jgi:putative membrane protein
MKIEHKSRSEMTLNLDPKRMDLTKTRSRFDRCTRALVAGALGGVLGGGAKILGELVFPPRFPGEPIPPVVAFSRLTTLLSGSPLLPSREFLATQLLHWPFSVGIAAVYAAVAEFFPVITLGRGFLFGLVLCLATHETLIPWAGFSLPWSEIPLKEHLSELLTHGLYGFVVESVRRRIRTHSEKTHSLPKKVIIKVGN